MTNLEIRELSTISHILAAGLAAVPANPLDMPLEVAQSLAAARAQMKSLPEVIQHLNLAADRCHTVSSALTGMINLADRAADAEVSDADRARLNAEFVNLAKVVAADAGRQLYQGPQLNLKSRGEALSAAKIVRYLTPVIETMDRELNEQKHLIHEVISETIGFLNIVAQCYPEAEGASALNLLVEATRPYRQPVSSPAGRLH